MNRLLTIALTLGLIVLGSGLVVSADEITDLIDEATKSYKAKNYSETIISLQEAIQKVQKLQMEGVKKYFPAAPSGFTAQDEEAANVGALFGGTGFNISRNYTQSEGSKTMQVTFMVNSALIQQMAMLITNPMFAGMNPNTESIKVKGIRGTYKYEKNNMHGEINLLVSGNFLVQVTGEMVEKDDLLSFAKTIDLEGIKKEFGTY